MIITKALAKERLGLSTDVELAKFFDCTKAAVGFWPDHGPLPKPRQWELIARRPDLFDQGKEAA